MAKKTNKAKRVVATKAKRVVATKAKRVVATKAKRKDRKIFKVGIFQAPPGDSRKFIVERETTGMGTVITYVSRKKPANVSVSS